MAACLLHNQAGKSIEYNAIVIGKNCQEKFIKCTLAQDCGFGCMKKKSVVMILSNGNVLFTKVANSYIATTKEI